jgi:hypothetical protein
MDVFVTNGSINTGKRADIEVIAIHFTLELAFNYQLFRI